MSEEAKVEEGEEVDIQEAPQYSESEIEAMDAGWSPDGKDKDGNTLSAEEFLARKPLFNKIRNMSEEIKEMSALVRELREDNKKIAKAGIEEKRQLLEKLKEQREKALDNLDTDEVRKLDKRIENVNDEIKPRETPRVSPYYNGFLRDNKWAENVGSAMYLAAEGMARQYLATHEITDGNDKPMYDYIHRRIREEFPEKFKEDAKRPGKVTSTQNRATSSYRGKKKVTLADLPEDEREVVKVMMRATGKTEEEYLKNYEI